MIGRKFSLIFGILVLSLFLIGVVSAGGDAYCEEDYYSGWKTFHDGFHSWGGGDKDIDYGKSSIYGNPTKWVDNKKGWVKIKVPSDLSEGEYQLTFKTFTGTSGEKGTEEFKVTCGGNKYNFHDNHDSGKETLRENVIEDCSLDSGDTIKFESSGKGDVHFWKYKLEQKGDCEPEEPVCGNGEVEEGEQCDFGEDNGKLCWAEYGSSCQYCTSSCKLKTITNYCGDGEKQDCEECDDGNNEDGDGCSAQCELEDPEPTCDYDVSVRESYGNSFGTGIAIKNDSWIEETPANLTEGLYEIKYFIDNEKSEEVEDVRIQFWINDNLLSNYSVPSINSYHSNSVEFNSTGLCGSHTLYLEAEKIDGLECNPANNYVQREIYVQCSEEPEPYCGDGIVNQPSEECDGESNCTNECKWEEDEPEEPEEPEKEGKKSRGNINEFNYCESNWVCSGWSECSEGVMTRDCYDSNYCGGEEINKPVETTSCEVVKQSQVEEPENNTGFILVAILAILLIILLIVLVNSRE